MFLGHHQIALSYGYKMFQAETVDDLSLEQYNVLVMLWNYKANLKLSQNQGKGKNTTSIVSIPGLADIDYGAD